jgi:hypothetical protein
MKKILFVAIYSAREDTFVGKAKQIPILGLPILTIFFTGSFVYSNVSHWKGGVMSNHMFKELFLSICVCFSFRSFLEAPSCS